MNLVFQVQIPPNGGRSEGRKVFHYAEDLYKFSSKKALAYAEFTEADYFCLKSDEWLGKKYSPAYHKLYIYELFKEGYDKILYIDSDIIVKEDTPNIFDMYDVLSACQDKSNSPSGLKKQQRDREKYNLREDYKYFCSGVVLFDRKFYEKTKDHWREELKKPQPQHDQSLFNILCNNYYGNCNILSNDWGHWTNRNPRTKKYMIHHASGWKKSFSTLGFLDGKPFNESDYDV